MTNRGLLRRQMRRAWAETIRSAYMDQVISSEHTTRPFRSLPHTESIFPRPFRGPNRRWFSSVPSNISLTFFAKPKR